MNISKESYLMKSSEVKSMKSRRYKPKGNGETTCFSCGVTFTNLSLQGEQKWKQGLPTDENYVLGGYCNKCSDEMNDWARGILQELPKAIKTVRDEIKKKGMTKEELKSLIKDMLDDGSLSHWNEKDWAEEYGINIDKVLEVLRELKQKNYHVKGDGINEPDNLEHELKAYEKMMSE